MGDRWDRFVDYCGQSCGGGQFVGLVLLWGGQFE